MSLVVHKYESKESLARASASNHLEKQFLNKDHDMGFYNDKKTAQQYIAMAEGYDDENSLKSLASSYQAVQASSNLVWDPAST